MLDLAGDEDGRLESLAGQAPRTLPPVARDQTAQDLARPPEDNQRIPERFRGRAMSVRQAASATPLPIGRLWSRYGA